MTAVPDTTITATAAPHTTAPDTRAIDLAALVDDLFRLLRLKTTPIGMQLFETVEAMQAVPRIRRPKGTVHTTDQIVGQAARLGFTVGITMADLVGQQCGAVIGLAPQDATFQAGKNFSGVWFATDADAAAHQQAMTCVPHGRYLAMAVSPLAAGRLPAPQIALVYANPAACPTTSCCWRCSRPSWSRRWTGSSTWRATACATPFRPMACRTTCVPAWR